MGSTALFIHLKIILLQYFQFLVFSNKRYSNALNAAYILEDDHLQKHDKTQAIAPPWWESFHFQLKHKFIDKTGSIFGAIYEYKCQDPVPTAPQYVIAFQGTILKKGTVVRDVKLNFKCFLNELHKFPCFQDAVDYVCKMVAEGARVWLAGHSLGSAMALLAGKNMAKKGCYLKTYLFNPPFFSFPIEAVPMDGRMKTGIGYVCLIAQACFNRFVNGRQRHEAEVLDPFVALSNWVLDLFVNPEDPICSEYIGYFGDRKMLEKKRLFGKLDKRVTKSSMDSDSESLHGMPSTDLTIYRGQLTEFQEQLSKYEKFKSAHGMLQWWSCISYQSLRYEYNATN